MCLIAGAARRSRLLLSGETSLYFSPVASGIAHVRQGRLRALAVTTAKRVPAVPDLPTVAEAALPGFESGNWYGVLAPAKTPKEVLATLHTAVLTVLRKPDAVKRLTELGYIIVGGAPGEFAAYMKLEVERFAKIIKAFNLTAD